MNFFSVILYGAARGLIDPAGFKKLKDSYGLYGAAFSLIAILADVLSILGPFPEIILLVSLFSAVAFSLLVHIKPDRKALHVEKIAACSVMVLLSGLVIIGQYLISDRNKSMTGEIASILKEVLTKLEFIEARSKEAADNTRILSKNIEELLAESKPSENYIDSGSPQYWKLTRKWDLESAKKLAEFHLAHDGKPEKIFQHLRHYRSSHEYFGEFFIPLSGGDTFILLYLTYAVPINDKVSEYNCRACGAMLSLFEFRKQIDKYWWLEQKDIGLAEVGNDGVFYEPSNINIIKLGPDRYALLLKDNYRWASVYFAENSSIIVKMGDSYREVFNYSTSITKELTSSRLSQELTELYKLYASDIVVLQSDNKDFYDISIVARELDESKIDFSGKEVDLTNKCSHKFTFVGKSYIAIEGSMSEPPCVFATPDSKPMDGRTFLPPMPK